MTMACAAVVAAPSTLPNRHAPPVVCGTKQLVLRVHCVRNVSKPGNCVRRAMRLFAKVCV
jgi:hypothetical protein